MAKPPEIRDRDKRAADWMRLRLAAMSDEHDRVRSYDWRYHAEISHEQALLEVLLAAALAREYVYKSTDGRALVASSSG